MHIAWGHSNRLAHRPQENWRILDFLSHQPESCHMVRGFEFEWSWELVIPLGLVISLDSFLSRQPTW